MRYIQMKRSNGGRTPPQARARRPEAGQVAPEPGETDDPRVVGAVSAYRGYRRQALYALYRLLSLTDLDRLQPEGVEDLSIESGGALVEVLQVKSLAAELALSHLDPDRPGSFLQAAAQRFRNGGDERLLLVSFGPLGPELTGIRDRNSRDIESVVRKLERMGIERRAAEDVLRRLEVQVVSEEVVFAAVMERLHVLLTGVDADAAFGLLTFWMYLQSERRETITVADTRERIQAVGRFLSAAHARHEEWFVTIVPIEDVEITAQRRSLLEAEFYQGVSVRYEHVAAGLAVERSSLLDAIDRGFEREHVVVVHAASGQGKTTLAYQYLSLLPSSWRFRIAAVPDRFHALQIAAALEGHASAVGLPVYVHLDVAPQDSEWPSVVREISTNEHIRVLVTIREEDWRRSTDLATLRFSDVDPTLSEGEARAIFSSLQGRFPDAPPTFEEAWARFGANGPLLEFVHLVTQRQELRDRLSEQVARLRSQAAVDGNSIIDFLRLASVVGANDARSELRTLAELVGLGDPAFAVAQLEREYLLRVSDDGRLVAGLHPIRSRILADLLTDPALAPLGEQLVAAVPVVAESDLETFMLGALSNIVVASHGLLAAALERQIASWTGFAGIGRALRWRGIAEYAERHRALIEEVDPDHMGRWSVMLDSDVAGAMPGGTRGMWETLAANLPNATGARDAVLGFQERQAPVAEAFAALRGWVERATKPSVPTTSLDWSAFAEMRFFATRMGVVLRPDWFGPQALDTALETASLDALGDLSVSLAEASPKVPADEVGGAWLDRHRGTLIDRYRRAVQAVALTDDGETIGIDFLMGVRSQEDLSGRHADRDANGEAVIRVELLRRLIPDRGFYAAQGWGHRVPGLGFDGTQKRIPRQSLPCLWLTSANATFRGYVERWWRPTSWSSYRETLKEWRHESCSRLEVLSRSLERSLRGATASPLDGITSEAWFQSWQSGLNSEALLPLDAVDPFGFVDESSLLAREGRDAISAGGLALEPYLGLIKTRRELARALGNFADQAPKAIALSVALSRASASDRAAVLEKAGELGIANLPRLSAHNLAAAVGALAPFQSTVANVLSHEPVGLGERERRAFDRALGMWRALTARPWVRFGDPSVEIRRQQQRLIDDCLSGMLDRLRALGSDVAWTMTSYLGSGGASLLVTASGADAVSVYGRLEDAVEVLHETLSGLPESELGVVESRLPEVFIVPLVRGTSISGEAVSLSTLVMANAAWSPEWWHFIPRPMPPDLESCFPRAVSPTLTRVNELAAAFGSLFGATMHLRDLPSREALDELGQELLDQHEDFVAVAMRELIKNALMDLERIADALQLVAIDAPYMSDLPDLMDDLRERLDACPFASDTVPRRAELDAWWPVLEDGIERMTFARLAWATVALSPSSDMSAGNASVSGSP